MATRVSVPAPTRAQHTVYHSNFKQAATEDETNWLSFDRDLPPQAEKASIISISFISLEPHSCNQL